MERKWRCLGAAVATALCLIAAAAMLLALESGVSYVAAVCKALVTVWWLLAVVIVMVYVLTRSAKMLIPAIAVLVILWLGAGFAEWVFWLLRWAVLLASPFILLWSIGEAWRGRSILAVSVFREWRHSRERPADFEATFKDAD